MRAPLIPLGVDLAVLVAAAVIVFGRRRWLRRQPGEFAGAIRVPDGVVGDLNPKRRRSSGRWARDVLSWSKARLILRSELLPLDRLCGEQPAHAGGVKRLGGKPVVIELASGSAGIEVAARAALVAGPPTIDVTSALFRAAPAAPRTRLHKQRLRRMR